jgi:putative ABC transport system substrate-binding protein
MHNSVDHWVAGAIEKRRHSPGTPVKACMPRSSNAMPEPTTKSFTVLETRTSPGIARPAIRLPICTAIPPTFLLTIWHSPVWSPALTSIPSERTCRQILAAQRRARPGPSKVAKKPSPAVSIFGSENDPVKAGLVGSFNRPEGNVTGVYFLSGGLAEKRLGLLRELLPRAELVGLLLNPNDPLTDTITAEVRRAASAVGQRIEVLNASNSREIDTVFAALLQMRASAFVLGPGSLFFTRRVHLVTLATRHGIPAIYTSREFAQAGGLMSYGADLADAWRQVGDYVGRVLKGAKPADLPVMQTTKLELVINLQTARVFDLEIPPTLLARADEVIE